jgi:hypothetical protein
LPNQAWYHVSTKKQHHMQNICCFVHSSPFASLSCTCIAQEHFLLPWHWPLYHACTHYLKPSTQKNLQCLKLVLHNLSDLKQTLL